MEKNNSLLCMLQEGKVRAKLERLLVGYKDVIYEKSDPTGEGVKAVSLLLV